jgi:hypothetical protein
MSMPSDIKSIPREICRCHRSLIKVQGQPVPETGTFQSGLLSPN